MVLASGFAIYSLYEYSCYAPTLNVALLGYRRQRPQAVMAMGTEGQGGRLHRHFARCILAMDAYRFH